MHWALERVEDNSRIVMLCVCIDCITEIIK
jgi:hypothetical protein